MMVRATFDGPNRVSRLRNLRQYLSGSDILMVASFLSRLFFGTNARRQAIRPLLSHQPALESRTLLAGNVIAKLVHGDLQLVGDSAANDVKISHTTAGIIVHGQSGTTINGGSTDFVAFAASVTKTGDIVAELGAGDDKLQIDNLTLDGHLTVTGGAGNDKLGMTQSTIHGGVVFVGGAGDDTFYAESSTIDGNLTADMGAGNDLVALTSTHVKHSLVMVGGKGNDRLALDSSTIDQWLIGHMGKGNDDVRLANGTLTNHVQLWTAGGDDLVQVNASHTTGSFFADLGRGNDSVSLVGAAQFDHSFVLLGGPGHDNADLGTATLPANKVLVSIKNRAVDAALLTARIDNATTGLLAAVQTARNAFFSTVTASVTGTGVLKAANGFVSDKNTVTATITGTAGQQVQVDKGSGFVDPPITLDNTGTATVSVTLANTTAANQGLNSIRVQQVVNGTPTGPIQTMAVQYTNTVVVRMATSKGNIDIQLFADDEPITTQNFLNYLARYQNSIIHRSKGSNPNIPAIIQGGGFDLVPPVTAITTDPAITNEFKPIHSNVRGTLSMAQLSGNINSGTSQWFFNTADNTSLNNVPHTVFGQIQGAAGLAVADAIQALSTFDLSTELSNGALTDLPLDGYTRFTQSLVGTVTVTPSSTTVNGTGTQFTTALRTGQKVQIGADTYTVATVTSNTAFTITTTPTNAVTAGNAKVNATPTDSQFVKITSVTVLPQLV